MRDTAFLAGVKPALPARTDDDLIKIGRATCGLFDTGASWPEVLKAMRDEGISAYAAGAMMGSAIDAYCPQHRDQLP